MDTTNNTIQTYITPFLISNADYFHFILEISISSSGVTPSA